MEEMKETKRNLRELVAQKLAALPPEAVEEKINRVENQLFSFANFLEAKIALLYCQRSSALDTLNIVSRSFDYNKVVVLPSLGRDARDLVLRKVDDVKTDLIEGDSGFLQPNPNRCKVVPVEYIDIAIIPGTAFDEKGGRIGRGHGYYDRLIPNLPITTRKVALAFEDQIVPQVPMESHDKYVDIIITEQRVIYKI